MVAGGAGSPLRVLIIDRDEVARAGMHTLLQGDARFTVVGELSRLQTEPAVRSRPQVIVLDPVDRRGVNAAFIGALAQALPESRVCVYTELIDPASFLLAMEHGARAYLGKGTARADFLLDSLYMLGRHDAVVIDPAIAIELPGQIRVRLILPAGPSESPSASGRCSR